MNSNTANIKITHKWSIENFGDFLLRGFAAASFIQSDSFQPSQLKEKLSFFLRLYPEGINRDVCIDDVKENCDINVPQSYMSLYLHLQDGADIKAVKCSFSIMDYNDKICNTKSIEGNLSKYDDLGLDEYIPNNSRIFTINRYFKARTMLTLVCQIEIPVVNLTICNGLSSQAVNSLEQPNMMTTESKSDASLTVVKHNYHWTIPQYDFIYQRNICSASHNFSLKDKEGLNFFLRLWPNGKGCQNDVNCETESDKYLSLFLYLSDCLTQNCVKALSRLSVRHLEKAKPHHSRWVCGELFGSNGLGCERFLAIDRANELLRENELDIHCEVELFCDEENSPENVDEIDALFLSGKQDKSEIVIIKNSKFNKCPINIKSTTESKDIEIK